MTPQQRIESWELHPSQRGVFAFELYKAMAANDRIYLLTGDLGYGVLNHHRDDFPDRFLNVGASEQLLLGAGVGLALSGRIPICYSITSFLLYRPFEWIRNYLQHEGIPVLLVGSGLDDDYKHDGITHQTYDARKVLNLFPRIRQYFPPKKEDVGFCLNEMIEQKQPAFLCLRR